MLKLIRRNTKRIIWVLVISFVLWGVSSSLITRDQKKTYVGEVFGKKVKGNFFNETYKIIYYSPRIQSLLRENPNVDESMLINSVFQHIAFRHEAQQRNLSISNAELRKEISLRFSPRGEFDSILYERWVKNVTGQSPRQYEEGVRAELLVQKLIDSIRDDITVSEEEIKDFFYKENRKLKLQYISLNIDNFTSNVSNSHEDLVQYYQDNIGKFKTKKKIKTNYILFSPDQFVDKVTITENELITYFEKYKEQLSDVTTGTAPDYESLKNQITETVTQHKALKLAEYAATDFTNRVQKVSQLTKHARENNYALIETPYLTISEMIEKIGWAQNLDKKLNTLEPAKLHMIQTTKGIILIIITNIKQAEIIGFDASESKVKQLLTKEQAHRATEQSAAELRNELLTGDISLNSVSSKYNATLHETDFFAMREEAIIDSRITTNVYNQLWDKAINYISMPIVLNNDTIAVFRIADILNPPEEEYEASRAEIETKVLQFKRYFELQTKLSEILKRAEIKKYPVFKETPQV